MAFAFFWLAVTFLMGFNLLDQASHIPSHLPGPGLFVVFPFAIGILGFIMVLGIVVMQQRMVFDQSTRVKDKKRKANDTAEIEDQSSVSEQHNWSNLEIPEVCDNCEYVWSREGLEWLGLLEFKCPYCGKILQAKRT